MYLQGNLQTIFDALYQLGIIDPLLKKDWENLSSIQYRDTHFQSAMEAANDSQSSLEELVQKLELFDRSTLEHLAMEVAREYVELNERKAVH